MKRRHHAAVLTVAFVLAIRFAAGQATEKAGLDALLGWLDQDKSLKSTSAISVAESVLAAASTRDEQLTAKTLLALGLQDRGDREFVVNDMNRAQNLWKEVETAGPDTWQGILARYYLATGAKRGTQVAMAREALTTLDFSILENSEDPALQAIRRSYGDRPNLFREAMKLCLVNALCMEKKIAEATQVQKTIEDTAFAELALNRIKLAEKEESERLKAIQSSSGSSPRNGS